MEGLPRPAAAGADDQCGTGDTEVLERFGRCVFTVVRGERLRRLSAPLVLDEERAAAGAIVRSFGVLEAALLTVDVAQRCLPSYSGGAAFEVRISVRWSTSTSSRMLVPPVFCSLATNSARRMSIFPCSR